VLGCGHDKATRLQRELVKHNLLCRKYQGKGKPAKLYVLTVPKISTEPP
jgi:predicted transcriptional regulator